MPLQIALLRQGIFINQSDLQIVKENENPLIKLKKHFTIRTKIINDHFVTTSQYKIARLVDEERRTLSIRIPRFGFFDLLNKPRKLIHCGMGKKFVITNHLPEVASISNLNWEGQLNRNQVIVRDYILDKYYNADKVARGDSGVILNLEAGQGKTYIALSLISMLSKPTLIVVHRYAILYDWKKAITAYFPNAKIGYYCGKKKEKGDIVLAIITSLTLTTDTFVFGSTKTKATMTTDEFFDQFGFIVFDEVHEMCSQSRSQVFWQAQAKYMLGLSATPNERADAFDPVSWWHIGPVLDAKTIPGYNHVDEKFEGEVYKVVYKGPPEYTRIIMSEATNTISTSKMLNQICDDPTRLDLVVEKIVEISKNATYNTYVFSDRKRYLHAISAKLITLQVEHQVVLTGGAADEEIKFAEDNAKVILTTYSYMSVGKSIPKMNALVLATPRKRKSRQIINRIFRLGSDASITRKIVDIIDWSTLFKSQWYKRKAYYDEKQYTIL